jgi:hypothetical protein
MADARDMSTGLAPPELPYSGWQEELKTIGALATKATGTKSKRHIAEARERLNALRQQTRERCADFVNPVTRVGEAVLFEASATIELLDQRHLHEATAYEQAATRWLRIERDRCHVNEPSTGEGLYKAIICTTLACAALVADAGMNGDDTVSLEAALRDAAIADERRKAAVQAAAVAAAMAASGSGPVPTASPSKDGEEEKFGEKASRFLAGLKSRLQQKAAEVKVDVKQKATEVKQKASEVKQSVDRRRLQNFMDPLIHVTASSMEKEEADGPKLLPRHAKPHNFKHSTRVHRLLVRVADELAGLGCTEVAADLFELSAAFVVDESPRVSQAQGDFVCACQRQVAATNAGAGDCVAGTTTDGGASAPSSANFAAAGSASGDRAQVGGNAVLFGCRCGLGQQSCPLPTVPADADALPRLLPVCRVPLQHVSRYLYSMRRAVTLRLALQHYRRVDETVQEALGMMEPFLAFHRASLSENDPSVDAILARHEPPADARRSRVSLAAQVARAKAQGAAGRLWFSSNSPAATSTGTDAPTGGRAAFDPRTGRRVARGVTVDAGGFARPNHPMLFGEAERGELRLLAAAHVVAGLLRGEPIAVVRSLIAAFENLSSNLCRAAQPRQVVAPSTPSVPAADDNPLCEPAGDADVTSACLVMDGRARTIAAAARFIAHCSERYLAEETSALPAATYCGVAVPSGPLVMHCALLDAVQVLISAASVPADSSFVLACNRIVDSVTLDPLPAYMSKVAPARMPADSPSPQRTATRRIDLKDLSP